MKCVSLEIWLYYLFNQFLILNYHVFLLSMFVFVYIAYYTLVKWS